MRALLDNWEWWSVEILALDDKIGWVQDSTSCFDERPSGDCIDSNMLAGGDDKAGWLALNGDVREIELESYVELIGDVLGVT